MNAIGNVINQIDSLVWGWWMIILLLGTHIFMTIRTGVIQRKIGTAIRLSVTKDHDAEGEVSQFGALTTALASTIGTGNIIGVGTAIALGGPGAVLWWSHPAVCPHPLSVFPAMQPRFSIPYIFLPCRPSFAFSIPLPPG